MKKILLSAIVFFALITTSNAQTIGATIGANIANVGSTDILNKRSKFNFTAGLFAEFMLSEKLGIQPEFVFSGQGYRYSVEDGTGFLEEWKQKLTYVNIPILFNYYVVENFYLQGGPYLGILTNAEDNVANTLGLFGGENKADFNSTDFGLALGVGFSVDKVNLGLRYQIGVSDISVDDRSIKNSVVNVSLGYRFAEDND